MEIRIPCSDGVQLAAIHWKPPSESTHTHAHSSAITRTGSITRKVHHRILCLHGWLDNAASFHLLAPRLYAIHNKNNDKDAHDDIADISTEIVALDLPGHGQSSHKSTDAPIQTLSEYTFYVHQTLSFLDWIVQQPADANDNNYYSNNCVARPSSTKNKCDNSDKSVATTVTIIGHSMGGAITLLYAGAFPEHVDRIVLLDTPGLSPRNTQNISRHVRSAIRRRLSSNAHSTTATTSNHGTNTKNKIHPSLESAIRTRIQTAQKSPGTQYISRQAAEALVERATVDVNPNPTVSSDATTSRSTIPVTFRHDGRTPYLDHFTMEHVDAVYGDVQCPVCFLQARDGWPISDWTLDRVGRILQPKMMVVMSKEKEEGGDGCLKGSHHFHADPETVEGVLEQIIHFFEMELQI